MMGDGVPNHSFRYEGDDMPMGLGIGCSTIHCIFKLERLTSIRAQPSESELCTTNCKVISKERLNGEWSTDKTWWNDKYTFRIFEEIIIPFRRDNTARHRGKLVNCRHHSSHTHPASSSISILKFIKLFPYSRRELEFENKGVGQTTNCKLNLKSKFIARQEQKKHVSARLLIHRDTHVAHEHVWMIWLLRMMMNIQHIISLIQSFISQKFVAFLHLPFTAVDILHSSSNENNDNPQSSVFTHISRAVGIIAFGGENTFFTFFEFVADGVDVTTICTPKEKRKTAKHPGIVPRIISKFHLLITINDVIFDKWMIWRRLKSLIASS